MKKCSKCCEIKELTEFHKDKSSKDGFTFSCKSCQKSFDQTPERKKYQQEYQQKPEVKYLIYNHGAKKRGYLFDLSFDQFTILINQPCTYCGQIKSNGVDRIDNSVGYTLENSAPCCSLCNDIKKDRSVKEMYTHILKMIKHTFKNWYFARK